MSSDKVVAVSPSLSRLAWAPTPLADLRPAIVSPTDGWLPDRPRLHLAGGPSVSMVPVEEPSGDHDPIDLASAPFSSQALLPHLIWFMASYTPGLSPDRRDAVMLASLRGLASIDPTLRVEQDGRELLLFQGDQHIGGVEIPANAGMWARTSERAASLFASVSPAFAAATSQARHDAFFRGLTRPLDAFSRYYDREQAARLSRRLDTGSPGDDVQARVEDGYGVLRISAFTGAAVVEARRQLTAWGLLEPLHPDAERRPPQVRGLVIDITDDSGGRSGAAQAIADMILRRGVIYRVTGNDSAGNVQPEADARGIPEDIPVMVIQNGATISAAEIFASAIQDNQRGVILGTSSFGKGREQTTRPVPGGGILAVTTGLVTTPAGVSNEGQGVTPNACIVDTGLAMDAATRSELRRRGEYDDSESNPIRLFCPPLPRRSDVLARRAQPLSDSERRDWVRQAIAILRDPVRYRDLLQRVERAPQPSVVVDVNRMPGLPATAGPR